MSSRRTYPGGATSSGQASLDMGEGTDFGLMTELASRVRDLSVSRWGPDKALEMVGASPAYLELQRKLAKVVRYRASVLVTGEAGVGKEQPSEPTYPLSKQDREPYSSVT